MSYYDGLYPKVKSGLVTRDFFINVLRNVFSVSNRGGALLGVNNQNMSVFDSGHGLMDVSSGYSPVTFQTGVCPVLPFAIPASVSTNFYHEVWVDDHDDPAFLAEKYDILLLKDVDSLSTNIGCIPSVSRRWVEEYQSLTMGSLISDGAITSDILSELGVLATDIVTSKFYVYTIRIKVRNPEFAGGSNPMVDINFSQELHTNAFVKAITPINNDDLVTDYRFCPKTVLDNSPETVVNGPNWRVNDVYLPSVRYAYWNMSAQDWSDYNYAYEVMLDQDMTIEGYTALLNQDPTPYEELEARIEKLEQTIKSLKFIQI